MQEGKTNSNVDIDELTEKLIDFKAKLTKKEKTYNGDSEDDENVPKTQSKTIIKTVSKSLNNSQILIANKQPARKPLSNLTNTIDSKHKNNNNEKSIISYAKKPENSSFHNQASTTNRYHNYNPQYQWYNHANYVREPYYQGQYFMNQAPIQNNAIYNQFQPSTTSLATPMDNASVCSTDQTATPSIKKMHLDPILFSDQAWTRYSEQLAMSHSPYIVWDAPYAISNVQFAGPFDLILKVWHQKPFDTKKYFKIYLVHKQYATEDKHSSEVLRNVIKERENTVDIDIQVQDICASAMHHVLIYMYTGHVTVTSKDLIPLFTLVERLKMKGDIEKQILLNIRNQYEANNDVLIPYLLQSKSVDAHSIIDELQLQIIKKAEKKQLKHIDLQNLMFGQFVQLFKESIILCSENNINECVPYNLIIKYVNYFTSIAASQSNNFKEKHFARAVLQKLLNLKEFNGDACSICQCIEFIKIMDILYGEHDETDLLLFYKECLNKVQYEFNPFDADDCLPLNDLLPKTFNNLLVNALHLQKSMIEVAILKYRELNYKKYKNQLKAFNFQTILNQRSQIYGEQQISMVQTLKTRKDKNDEKELSPPIIRTPPSPPKSHNECFSPVAPRYRIAPKLTNTKSNTSLLEQIEPVPVTPDILDAAIAHIQQENLQRNNSQSDIDSIIETKYIKNTDVSAFNSHQYISPESNVENGARNTLSHHSIHENQNQNQNNNEGNQAKCHLISPDFTPEKLVFTSRATTPRNNENDKYVAPKINKGCLVETIDKYHSGVAKLYSPPKWRNDKPLNIAYNNVLESRVITTSSYKNNNNNNNNKSEISPRRRSGNSSPSKRRGSGGAYCVECNEWRHKFDFTKSQWRNRPRGFRRCKFCTGEIGSDSKQSPCEYSPRRYRLKSSQMI